MIKLETLDLSSCYELQKFPDIQTNMDSLVNLHLHYTSIEIIPPSVGQFCTNLVSFDLHGCYKLKRIEGNFHLLKRLKDLNLSGCSELEKLAEDFFDKDCCLELEMSMDSQPSHCEEFDKNCESYDQYERVGYVPFGSLRLTSWWNPTYTNISVEIHDVVNPKVVFVRRKDKIGDSRERAIDCSEFWDKEREDEKTFDIIDDPKSSKIKIVW
ncbi:hypothetical protein L1987_61975 [Smallanthus sonchifolius]|uniref:Uncharacterized protein n=1 Tax=Smallanthus sonchifolius TaxID=185202 RepID=A0ACB9C979_9ASTR|nr:hypothetical protein L1987_61975 [Smallanthus sonchifolius]